MKILLVDSKLEGRKLLKDLLVAQGHKVDISTDGMAALVKLTSSRGKFDLLLTETKIACVSGPELVEELKVRKSRIVVIGMSESDESKGAYPHFWNRKLKPATLVSLIKKIAQKGGTDGRIIAH